MLELVVTCVCNFQSVNGFPRRSDIYSHTLTVIITLSQRMVGGYSPCTVSWMARLSWPASLDTTHSYSAASFIVGAIMTRDPDDNCLLSQTIYI